MKYPFVNPIQTKQEMTATFTGYNHTLSCVEGFNYDQKNMSSDYYPVLSPRKKRGICHTFTNFQGMVDKDGLIWVDNGKLYINGTQKAGFSLTNTGMKTITKMGAYLVFFPDKKWYNTADNSYGDIEATVVMKTFQLGFARSDGSAIDFVVSVPPVDGQYKCQYINGKPAVYQYSSLTNTWNPITDVYMRITLTNPFPFPDIKKGDGVKITIEDAYLSDYDKNYIFINKEPNDCHSAVLTVHDLWAGNGYTVLVFPVTPYSWGIYYNVDTNLNTIKREVPSMSHVVECNNRLWGCSTDGHEIYASKLGDPTNWNVFQGISTDSWAANIGSDGAFTGAASLQGYPLFFKEDSLLKVSISPVGAHSYVETKCRGVAAGSEGSLATVNEILYYKSRDSICVYDGSYPIEISANFGDVKYTHAVGGSVGNKYYICLKDENNNYHIFNYNAKNGVWVKEDNKNIKQFCKSKSDLFFVEGQTLFSEYGSGIDNSLTLEGDVDWMVESADIGYLWTSKKHSSRMNNKNYIKKLFMQTKMTQGAHISVWINYDSSDVWEHLFNVSGTKSFLQTVNIRPHRCNHFRYRLIGKGDAKIYSITKEYSEGSDI